MEAFGIIGMSLGAMGFIYALNAMNAVSSLEKRLKEAGVLGEGEGGSCGPKASSNP
jgi:hypothetical protein